MTTSTIPTWTLGDRLAKARRDGAHLTTRDMAAALGVSKNTVSNWETGTTMPRRYAVEAWARITGVDVDWLLGELTSADTAPADPAAHDEHDATPTERRAQADRRAGRNRWDSPSVRRMRPEDGVAVAA